MARLLAAMIAVALAPAPAQAAAGSPERADGTAAWQRAAERRLAQEPALAGLRLRVEPLAHEPLPPRCAGPWTVTPASGARWPGSGALFLACAQPAWRGSVNVRVSAVAPLVVASRALAAGAVVGAEDLRVVEADADRRPAGALGDPAAALGRQLVRALREDQPLTLNALRTAAVIRQGERVIVLVAGAAFEVTGEGVAQQGGGVGETIRVRLADGRQLSAVVTRAGVVEVRW